MSEPGITLTKDELQELLSNAVAAAIGAAKALNPLEQKKYDEALAADERRKQMMVALGKIEEESARRKKEGCSHCRWPMSAGRNAGSAAPKGQGEWCTSGQIHGYDTIGLICQRCGTVWVYRATPQELEYAQQAGLLGMAPPPDSRLLAA